MKTYTDAEISEQMFAINDAIREGTRGMTTTVHCREDGMAWENELMSAVCEYGFEQEFRDLIRAHVNHETSRTIHQLVYTMLDTATRRIAQEKLNGLGVGP